MSNVPNVLLAAGSSSRMGTPKQLLPWNGKTLIEHQIETLLETKKEAYVVLGAFSEQIQPLVKRYPVQTIVYEDWSMGMGNTIAYAINQLQAKSNPPKGVLFALSDQPLVTSAHYKLMHATFQSGREQIIVSVSESGWEGVPVLFDYCYFQYLKKLNGEFGAKQILKKLDRHMIKIEAGSLLVDMDTPEAYTRLYKKFNLQ